MRVLWQSNAPWAGTGYGQQTKLMLPALRELGHEPVCFAFWGLAGGAIDYDGYPVLPSSNADDWGNDVIAAHVARSEAEVVITLMDLFVLAPEIYGKLKVPWIAWMPVDHIPMSEANYSRLEHVEYPVAMSNFGAQMMMDRGIRPARVIYHAVDTKVFFPRDKKTVREKFGIEEDEFVIGMVMANKGDRKQYPAQFDAVSKWIKQHPDRKIRLYLHTESTNNMGGWLMKTLVEQFGLSGKVSATNRYDTSVVAADPDLMAQIYSTMDVLMNCSAGEGFGIPIIEAQACGVPVIAGNYTSMPEIVQNGYLVEPSAKIYSNHYAWHFVPNVEDMVYRLECVYRMDDRYKRESARDWVVRNCSVEVIAKQWDELLQQVARDIESGTFVGTPRTTTVSLQATLTGPIVQARDAMKAEAEEYGTYSQRIPEYEIIFNHLRRHGLANGMRVLDLGAGQCDLDRYMREHGWWGTYVPVDMVIDGQDLRDYQVPFGFEVIVCEQVIEHLEHWEDFLEVCEDSAPLVVVATPNGAVVPEHDKQDMAHQMAHVVWLTPEDLQRRGYETYTYSLTGRANDTIVAVKVRGSEDDAAADGHRRVEVVH